MQGLLSWAGLLVLLAGLVWLAVVLDTQGVDWASAWASVLSTGLTITGALITLATWWWRRPAAGQLAGGQDHQKRPIRHCSPLMLRYLTSCSSSLSRSCRKVRARVGPIPPSGIPAVRATSL